MAYLLVESAVVRNREGSLAAIFYIVQKIQYCGIPAMK